MPGCNEQALQSIFKICCYKLFINFFNKIFKKLKKIHCFQKIISINKLQTICYISYCLHNFYNDEIFFLTRNFVLTQHNLIRLKCKRLKMS